MHVKGKIVFVFFVLFCFRLNSQSFSVAVVPNISVCIGSGNITLSASVSGSGTFVYAWSPASEFANPSLQNQLISPSVTSVYTVTAYEISNPTVTAQATSTVTVKPKIPFSLGPDQVIYTGGTLNLTGPPGATAYNWWGSTSFTSNTQSLLVPNLTSSNSGVYVLEVDLNGCQTYDSVNVNVVDPIQFNLIPANRTICRGENVNFVVGCWQGPSGVYSYSWTPQIGLNTYTGYAVAGNPLNTTIYTIFACDVADPSYTIATSFTVTVNQPPTPSVAIPTSSVCEPACYGFTSNCNPTANSIVYDFGNNNVKEGDSINVCLNAGIHYMRIVTTGTSGCKGTYDYITPIVVFPKPGSNFIFSPTSPNLSNNAVSFSPTNNNSGPFTYKWYFDANDSSSNSNPIKVYNTTGSHTVKLITKNNFACSDTVTKSFGVGPAFRELTLYPNPTFESLNVELGILAGGSASLYIYDVLGNIVFKGKQTSFQSVLNISFLAAGFYTLQAESNGVIKQASFIKK